MQIVMKSQQISEEWYHLQHLAAMRLVAVMGWRGFGRKIMKRAKNSSYEARYEGLFGKPLKNAMAQQNEPERNTIRADRGETADKARPAVRRPVGAGILLTAEEIVHGLFALSTISDPERWLKRHGAPVALDTGHAKRYLLADTLDWAAQLFAPTEQSRATLREIAEAIRHDLGAGGAEGRSESRVTGLPSHPENEAGAE
jgi:hypothetical protein